MDWFFQDILWHNRPSTLSDSRQRLSQNTTSFIQLYEGNEATMRQILDQLLDLSAALERNEKEMTTWIRAATVLLAAGALLAVLAARATKGWSFAVYGAAAACGFVTLFCFIAREMVLEQPHVRRMKSLTEEFRLIVNELKNSLEGVKSLCGDVRKESVGAEAVKFIRLEISILELLSLTEKLRASSSLSYEPKQVETVERISDGFRRMKTDLETFYR